jgi:hypothetical protein
MVFWLTVALNTVFQSEGWLQFWTIALVGRVHRAMKKGAVVLPLLPKTTESMNSVPVAAGHDGSAR